MFALRRSVHFVLAIAILDTLILGINGKRMSGINSSGFKPVTNGQFRYIVGIFVDKDAPNDQHFQGFGTIISDRHILTAALCVRGYSSKHLSVVSGIEDFNDPRGEMHEVTEVILPPKDSDCNNCSWRYKYDIGLLKLKNSMVDAFVEESLQQLFFPYERARIETFTMVTAGRNSTISSSPKIIHTIELAPIELRSCKIAIRHAKSAQRPGAEFIEFDDRFICTQPKNAGICPDGMGSPLVNNGYVIGVSLGGRCLLNDPNVFSNVHHYRLWIFQEISRI